MYWFDAEKIRQASYDYSYSKIKDPSMYLLPTDLDILRCSESISISHQDLFAHLSYSEKRQLAIQFLQEVQHQKEEMIAHWKEQFQPLYDEMRDWMLSHFFLKLGMSVSDTPQHGYTLKTAEHISSGCQLRCIDVFEAFGFQVLNESEPYPFDRHPDAFCTFEYCGFQGKLLGVNQWHHIDRSSRMWDSGFQQEVTFLTPIVQSANAHWKMLKSKYQLDPYTLIRMTQLKQWMF